MASTDHNSQSMDKTGENSSSIKLDSRHDRSIRMAILQTLVKPFRPRLVSPPKNKKNQFGNTPGSPKLTSHPSIHDDVSIKELQVSNVYIYEFSAKLPSNIKYRPKHDFYYFAGGSFTMPPSKEHWKLCSELAKELPEYRIHIVSSPLAPLNRADTSLPILRELVDELINRADKKNRYLTLAGDSSGGNIAMSLGLHIADKATADQGGHPRSPLKNIFLISPPMDLQNDNPDIATANKFDPVMTQAHTSWVAQQWTSEALPAPSPNVSPIRADLTSLRKLGVQVHGVVGTYDVLAPDAISFRRRLEEFGVSGQWLEWEKQMHCFPLAFVYGVLPEANQGKDWILEVLKEHA